MRQKAGRITAAGVTKKVILVSVAGPINDRFDTAYRAKYHGSPYLKSMISARARSREGHTARHACLIADADFNTGRSRRCRLKQVLSCWLARMCCVLLLALGERAVTKGVQRPFVRLAELESDSSRGV
jgi:hypothetical protein